MGWRPRWVERAADNARDGRAARIDRGRRIMRPEPRGSGEHAMRYMPAGFCLLCDEPAAAAPNLCTACARELPVLPEPCIVCGAAAVPLTGLCRACAMQRPPVARTVCALAYAPPVDYLIGRLKFDRDLRVVPALAIMLGRAVAHDTGADWLVPVPITRARLRERGFNQALEIARVLGRRFGIPLCRVAHRRSGAEPPQSSLHDTAARRANVRDVFTARAAIDGRVVIVDDVVTTGATVNALARCLKKAGACRVDVWAVARTP